MDELDDRWILPAAGYRVLRWCISDTLTIELSHGAQADATVIIAGPFEFQTADRFRGGIWRSGSSSDVLTFAVPRVLSELNVERAEAHKDGTLEMAFSDGSRLRVPPNAQFESWEFTGPNGAKVVALPGGDLAVWRPAA